LLSNVFLSPGKDHSRIGVEIRGAPALRKYLQQIASGLPVETAAREKLRPWQQAQLAYELGCNRCGALPEGRVRSGEGDRIEFRCPRGTCGYSSSRALTINIDIEVLERYRRKYGFDISGAVQKAVSAFADLVGPGLPPGPKCTQMPVRLTSTQFYLMKFESIQSASQIVHACLLAFEKQTNG
jgi:hypothetical protein